MNPKQGFIMNVREGGGQRRYLAIANQIFETNNEDVPQGPSLKKAINLTHKSLFPGQPWNLSLSYKIRKSLEQRTAGAGPAEVRFSERDTQIIEATENLLNSDETDDLQADIVAVLTLADTLAADDDAQYEEFCRLIANRILDNFLKPYQSEAEMGAGFENANNILGILMRTDCFTDDNFFITAFSQAVVDFTLYAPVDRRPRQDSVFSEFLPWILDKETNVVVFNEGILQACFLNLESNDDQSKSYALTVLRAILENVDNNKDRNNNIAQKLIQQFQVLANQTPITEIKEKNNALILDCVRLVLVPNDLEDNILMPILKLSGDHLLAEDPQEPERIFSIFMLALTYNHLSEDDQIACVERFLINLEGDGRLFKAEYIRLLKDLIINATADSIINKRIQAYIIDFIDEDPGDGNLKPEIQDILAHIAKNSSNPNQTANKIIAHLLKDIADFDEQTQVQILQLSQLFVVEFKLEEATTNEIINIALRGLEANLTIAHVVDQENKVRNASFALLDTLLAANALTPSARQWLRYYCISNVNNLNAQLRADILNLVSREAVLINDQNERETFVRDFLEATLAVYKQENRNIATAGIDLIDEGLFNLFQYLPENDPLAERFINFAISELNHEFVYRKNLGIPIINEITHSEDINYSNLKRLLLKIATQAQVEGTIEDSEKDFLSGIIDNLSGQFPKLNYADKLFILFEDKNSEIRNNAQDLFTRLYINDPALCNRFVEHHLASITALQDISKITIHLAALNQFMSDLANADPERAAATQKQIHNIIAFNIDRRTTASNIFQNYFVIRTLVAAPVAKFSYINQYRICLFALLKMFLIIGQFAAVGYMLYIFSQAPKPTGQSPLEPFFGPEI